MSGDRVSVGRRRFLARAGMLAGAPLVAAEAGRRTSQAEYKPVALSPLEMNTLTLVLSRLIPADAEMGGAVEADVHVYIDRSLSGAYSRHLPTYRDGLLVIASLMRSETGVLPPLPVRLDAILSRLEAGNALQPPGLPTLDGGGKKFFALLLQHTLEGIFGDPVHGGNRAYIGWEIIGYPGIRLFNSQVEQALGVHPAPEHHSLADFGRNES
jgi:gluconate 2-dehydrogenase gamma chain